MHPVVWNSTNCATNVTSFSASSSSRLVRLPRLCKPVSAKCQKMKIQLFQELQNKWCKVLLHFTWHMPQRPLLVWNSPFLQLSAMYVPVLQLPKLPWLLHKAMPYTSTTHPQQANTPAPGGEGLRSWVVLQFFLWSKETGGIPFESYSLDLGPSVPFCCSRLL